MKMNFLRVNGEVEKIEYKTLEQQIQELWNSRGMEVVEERVRAIGDEKFEWTIIAKSKK